MSKGSSVGVQLQKKARVRMCGGHDDDSLKSTEKAASVNWITSD